MKVFINSKAVNLPDVFIPGAAKSGTTSLYRMISQHPDIYFPPSEKEPFFFCFGDQEPTQLEQQIIERVTYSEKEYLKLYQNPKESQVLFDGSTSYLYKHEDAIANMHEYYGESLSQVKIIILLRNPIERAWSHYNFLIRNGFETLSFEDAIKPETIAARSPKRWGYDYLGFGLYSDQVNHFKQVFPLTKIFLLEDLKNPVQLCDEIFDFLGLPPFQVSNMAKANPSGVPKNKTLVNLLRKNKVLKKSVNLLPEMLKHKILAQRDRVMATLLTKKEIKPEIRQSLASFYRKDIEDLEKLLGRDLGNWKE